MQSLLGAVPGSASVFGLIYDPEQRVRLLIDRELLHDAYISGHPCFSTSTLKVQRQDLHERFLPAVGHAPTFVDPAWPEVAEQENGPRKQCFRGRSACCHSANRTDPVKSL